MKRPHWTAAGFLLLSVCAAGTDEPDWRGLVRDGIGAFNRAMDLWTEDRFEESIALFRRAGEAAPTEWAPLYWQGAALFHEGVFHAGLEGPEHRHASACLRDQATAALQGAVRLRPEDGESHALLCALYGMKTREGLLGKVIYGPRVQSHGRRAEERGKENPRVQYLLGTCHFHAARGPEGLKSALVYLERAEDLFEREAALPDDGWTPRWGYIGCLAFLGAAQERLGRGDAAAAYYRRALARQPAHHMALEGLARIERK